MYISKLQLNKNVRVLLHWGHTYVYVCYFNGCMYTDSKIVIDTTAVTYYIHCVESTMC